MTYLQPAPLPLLTLLILVPLVGALLTVLGRDDRTVKLGATAWSLLPLGLAGLVWLGFDPALVRGGQGVVQFVERVPWVEAIKINYFLGVDGISLPLVLLAALMTPVAMLASWNVNQRVKAHYALLFVLEAAMLGYFVALDFFFFFLFWEFSLVPAFFLIQHWGRDRERRRRAGFTFFVYTLAGSLGLLLLFQFVYVATSAAGTPTFDLIALGRLGQGLDGGRNLQTIIFDYAELNLGITNVLGRFPLLYTSIAFWAIFVAFGIKLGVWPFHTWLPDAYSEAPTAGSIMLAAVMSKMGAYGMLRIMLPLVPDAAQVFGPVIGALGLISVVAGAFGALAHVRGDAKRLVAYTSINHMGYVVLAIGAAATAGSANAASRAIALNGAIMQLVAHGLSTGALFLLLGLLHERTGTYDLSALGGLRKTMPNVAALFGIALFANLGLPGLAGFVGEFFIMRGVWATLPLFALLATIGLVVSALALLRMYGAIFNGPVDERLSNAPDLPLRSRGFLAVAPLLALLVALGIYPAPLLDIANTTVTALAQLFTQVLS